MINRYFWFVLLFLVAGFTFVRGGEFATILNKDKNVEEGYTFYSKYMHVAFLNASAHSSRILASDFKIMPRSDQNNQHTLDEKEAKVRIFCKPDVRALTAAKRPARLHADEPWKIEKIADGLRYTRSYHRASSSLAAEVIVKLDKEKSQMFVEAVLKNTGSRDCKGEFSCEFAFLRTEVEPLNLTLQREFARYSGGKRVTFMSNERTLLNGKSQNYWWRRVAKDADIFSNYFNRECIPFTHPRLQPPGVFGFTGLIGNSALVWELDKSTKLTELDISWDGERGDATPMWSVDLLPGDSKKITFRLLAVRGIEQFDAVSGEWIFGYGAKGEVMRIISVPIRPYDRLALNATISNQQNMVLINQRSELPAMNPFVPGRVELRAMAPFQPNSGYPAKLQLHTVADNSMITEVSSNIVP